MVSGWPYRTSSREGEGEKEEFLSAHMRSLTSISFLYLAAMSSVAVNSFLNTLMEKEINALTLHLNSLDRQNNDAR